MIVVALCYGARKLMERYILLKFARKEYFNSLKKLMFEEKIVFKLLEYKLQKERSKMRKRKKKEREENSPDQFEWGAEEEISPGPCFFFPCFFFFFFFSSSSKTC